MAIKTFKFGTTGEDQSVKPRIVRLETNDTLSTITTAGYADVLVNQGYLFETTDEVHVLYGTDSSSFAILRPTLSGQSVTLVPWVNPADVTAPVISGNLPKFSGTTGLLVDSGFALLAGLTSAYAGGGTSNTFTATGLTTSHKIVGAVINASTNAVGIDKAVAGTDQITVTFSADPGAGTTVGWTAIL